MKHESVSHEVQISSKHKVIVLKPVIDNLTMTVKGEEAIVQVAQASGHKWKAASKDYWEQFYKSVHFKSKKKGSKVLPLSGFSPHYRTAVRIALSEHESIKLLTEPRSPSTAPARVEFNPSKLSQSAMIKLSGMWSILDGGQVPFQALVKDARVSRIDIAVDCLGLRPIDIWAYHKDVWKVWTTSGIQAGTETALFYLGSPASLGPQVSPKRRANLMIYDKRREQLARGLTPVFGDQEHTRIERCMRKTCLLPSLKKLKNPFADWRIRRTLVSEAPFDSWLWMLILDSARYRGVDAAFELVPDHVKDGVALDPSIHAPADLITEKQTWSHWPNTLTNGLVGQLIGWAESDLELFLPPSAMTETA